MKAWQSLKDKYPEIAKEADGWDPQLVTSGSSKLFNWMCPKGHRYRAAPSKRTASRPTGCPFCAGKKILKGFNDLATTHPDLASEVVLGDPTSVSQGSEKVFTWKCSHGHLWEAKIYQRMNGGCPYCSGHRVLKGFNDLASQYPDLAKQAYGWDPSNYVSGSGKRVTWQCQFGHLWLATPSTRLRGSGCPTCASKKILPGFNDLKTKYPDIAKDSKGWDPSLIAPTSNKKMNWSCPKGHEYQMSPKNRTLGKQNCAVCSGKQLIPGVNDFQFLHPDLANEAIGWDPSKFSEFSHRKMKWRCNKGHEWLCLISSRSNGVQCHYCSNQVLLIGYNDLETVNPEIAKEADGWDPSKVLTGGGKLVEWKCSIGHKWRTTISSRTSVNTGCPTCADYGFSPEIDGFLYLLEHETWGLMKIGITNFKNQRTKTHEKKGWRVIEVQGPMRGIDAYFWEQEILKSLKMVGVEVGSELTAGKFDGYTETWARDRFPATTIKELMDITDSKNK